MSASESESSPPGEYDLLISTSEAVTVARILSGRSYTVGRVGDCDIIVDDASVSRRHARIVAGPAIEIEDLGSSNGTRIAGRRLPVGETARVAVGTIVDLGSATLVFQRGRSLAIPDAGRTGGRHPSRPPGAPSAAASHNRVVLDPTMLHIYAMLDLVAPTMLAVLILGETGVGKEVFAQEVHRRSRRAGEPFLQLNCAALPESILEAELFGYERGAFTGATTSKAGLFEAADRGTVFLDEVGDMPPTTQVKLLRFLESGEVLRLGSVKPRRVDVRIVSATNRDLQRAMADGQFRTDLYYRLNGMTFTIPPLRQRRPDILPLATMFVQLAASRLGRHAPKLSPAVVDMLETRHWVGNVRELKNVLERAVVLSGGDDERELRLEHFPEDGLPPVVPPRREEDLRPPSVPTISRMPLATSTFPEATPTRRDLTRELRELERQRILGALTECDWNQSKAARTLGISRAVLMNRMKVFALSRPDKAASESPGDDGSLP